MNMSYITCLSCFEIFLVWFCAQTKVIFTNDQTNDTSEDLSRYLKVYENGNAILGIENVKNLLLKEYGLARLQEESHRVWTHSLYIII